VVVDAQVAEYVAAPYSAARAPDTETDLGTAEMAAAAQTASEVWASELAVGTQVLVSEVEQPV
jgi:hypothetical protein